MHSSKPYGEGYIQGRAHHHMCRQDTPSELKGGLRVVLVGLLLVLCGVRI